MTPYTLQDYLGRGVCHAYKLVVGGDTIVVKGYPDKRYAAKEKEICQKLQGRVYATISLYPNTPYQRSLLLHWGGCFNRYRNCCPVPETRLLELCHQDARTKSFVSDAIVGMCHPDAPEPGECNRRSVAGSCRTGQTTHGAERGAASERPSVGSPGATGNGISRSASTLGFGPQVSPCSPLHRVSRLRRRGLLLALLPYIYSPRRISSPFHELFEVSFSTRNTDSDLRLSGARLQNATQPNRITPK